MIIISRAFVIPDVHLKPWIFDRAEEHLKKENVEVIVFLGDLVDDWDQQSNIELYNETFDRALKFINDHENIRWCYGNHDVSYLWNRIESGFSWYAQETVVRRMRELQDLLGKRIAFIHRIGNTLFSHAGLMESFVKNIFPKHTSLNDIISDINSMGSMYMWDDDSPIWARPQHDEYHVPYPKSLYQVVGHTPVVCPLLQGNLLTVDNFSSYPDGKPLGSRKFVIVDTLTFEYVELPAN